MRLNRKGGAMRPIAVYTKAWRSSGTGLFAQELVKGLLATGSG
jgi:hypothetical protein